MMKAAILMIAALALLGCAQPGPDKATEPSLPVVPESVEGEKAFESGFYAWAKTQGCIECHSSSAHPKIAGYYEKTPFFADPNPKTAYTAARTLLNANSPASSAIIAHSGNGHCSHTPCQDPSVESTVAQMLATWAAAELGGQPPATGPKYKLAAFTLPTNIRPAAGTTATTVLRLSLSGLSPAAPGFTGAILELEVQMINAGSYRFIKPKLAGISSAKKVKGIHLFIRAGNATGMGAENLSQGAEWSTLDVTARPFALPATMPTTPLAATSLSDQANILLTQSANIVMTPDVITVAFDDLQ